MQSARWLPWLACAPVAVTAGWMLADGARAILVGDYVTPSAGPYAGQLGPWADLLAAVGLNPRSTAVKVLHVTYGATTLVAITRFLRRRPSAGAHLRVAAFAGLWYLPFGTVLNGVALALLSLPAMRRYEPPTALRREPRASGR